MMFMPYRRHNESSLKPLSANAVLMNNRYFTWPSYCHNRSSTNLVITFLSRQCHRYSVIWASFMFTRCITGRNKHFPFFLSLHTAKRLQSVERRVLIIKQGFERLMAQFKVRMHLGYGLNKSSERHTFCVFSGVFLRISAKIIGIL